MEFSKEDIYFDEVITLTNGIRILHIPTNGEVVHVQIDVKTGFDDESEPYKFESAHFLEHLIAQFSSTKDKRNSIEIAEHLESLGVIWNAFTTPHRTGYYLTGPKEAFKEMTKVLINAFFYFKVDNETIFENEKNAVEEELKRISNLQWYDLIYNHNLELYPNHPRSAKINDRLSSTKKLTIKDLNEFKNDFYATEEIIITLASPYKPKDKNGEKFISKLKNQLELEIKPKPKGEKFISKLEKQLEIITAWKRERKKEFPFLKLPEQLNSIITYIFKPDVSSSQIFISFRVPYKYFDNKKRWSIFAISMILTSGFSSRLLKRLRTQEGLIYSIKSYSDLDPYDKNMSSFTIQTSTDNEKLGIVIRIILEEISKLGNEGITLKEEQKYKRRTKNIFDVRALYHHPEKWVSTFTENLLWKKKIEKESDHRKDALSIRKKEIDTIAHEIFLISKQIIISYGGPKNFNKIIKESFNLSFNINNNQQQQIKTKIINI